MNADARDVLYDARSNLDEPLSDGRELSLDQRACLGNGRSHRMHQPECSGVQHKANLIGRCAVTGGAVRGELGLVQFDQILHQPALAIDALVKVLWITCQ